LVRILSFGDNSISQANAIDSYQIGFSEKKRVDKEMMKAAD